MQCISIVVATITVTAYFPFETGPTPATLIPFFPWTLRRQLANPFTAEK